MTIFVIYHICFYQQEEDLSGKAPERVFKIVFVGDSGVGKSSFIHRFCNNVFKATFSATIGKHTFELQLCPEH